MSEVIEDIERIRERVKFITNMMESYNDEELFNSFQEELLLLSEEVSTLQEKNKV